MKRRSSQNQPRQTPKKRSKVAAKAAKSDKKTVNAAVRNTVFREMAKMTLSKNINPTVRAALVPAMTRLSRASANVRRNPNVTAIRRAVADASRSLIKAVYQRDMRTVVAALKRHKELGISPGRYHPEQELTALHAACRSLEPKMVRILLANGANPNVTDVQGRTPLFDLFLFTSKLWNAHASRMKKCYVMLVQSGLDIRRFDTSGNTAFHVLAGENYFDKTSDFQLYIRDFVQEYAPHMYNAKNARGDTMLHIAASKKNWRIRREYVSVMIAIPHIRFCVKNNDNKIPAEMTNDPFVQLVLAAAVCATGDTRCSDDIRYGQNELKRLVYDSNKMI